MPVRRWSNPPHLARSTLRQPHGPDDPAERGMVEETTASSQVLADESRQLTELLSHFRLEQARACVPQRKAADTEVIERQPFRDGAFFVFEGTLLRCGEACRVIDMRKTEDVKPWGREAERSRRGLSTASDRQRLKRLREALREEVDKRRWVAVLVSMCGDRRVGGGWELVRRGAGEWKRFSG